MLLEEQGGPDSGISDNRCFAVSCVLRTNLKLMTLLTNIKYKGGGK